MQNPDFLLIDLFCGAGGVSTGAAQSGCVKVIAAVNHDDLAIKSHASNHSDTHHFVEDIRELEMSDMVAIANKAQNQYPDAELVLWARLECTNFSKAKGGLPRDADSRTLAEHLPRYIRALNPDKIMIENVEEFLAWGPLDDNGKPLNRKNGRDYMRWVKSITALGYKWDWKILNSAESSGDASCRKSINLPTTMQEEKLKIRLRKIIHENEGDTDDVFSDVFELIMPLIIGLTEIKEGWGAYSKDPLKHAENTIKNSKQIASKLIDDVLNNC